MSEREITELGSAIDVEIDEPRFADGWRRIEAQAFPSSRPTSKRDWIALSVGALAAAAAIAISFSLFRTEPPGPLRGVGGESLGAAIAGATEAGGVVTLDDGSRLRLDPGTRFDALENTGEHLVLLLREGEVHMDVTPGGPRRWTIEAGVATVQVIGTVFTVRRDEAEVWVGVERGRVLVRSRELEDHVALLTRGQTLRIAASESSELPQSTSAPPSLEPPSSAAPADAVALPLPSGPEIAPFDRRDTPAAAPARPTPPSEPPPSPERDSTESPAPSPPASAEPPPLEPAPALPQTEPQITAEDLLLLADAARRAGDVAHALSLLAIAGRRQNDPDAALASLTRARLLLRQHRAAEAVQDLRRALRGSLPAGLRESARHRLVTALARAGAEQEARDAADRYLAEYPNGAFRDAVERARP